MSDVRCLIFWFSDFEILRFGDLGFWGWVLSCNLNCFSSLMPLTGLRMPSSRSTKRSPCFSQIRYHNIKHYNISLVCSSSLSFWRGLGWGHEHKAIPFFKNANCFHFCFLYFFCLPKTSNKKRAPAMKQPIIHSNVVLRVFMNAKHLSGPTSN